MYSARLIFGFAVVIYISHDARHFSVLVNAVTAVNYYFKSTGGLVPTINASQYLQRETRRAQVNTLREAKNVMFCLDYSGSMAGDRMER